MRFLTCLVTSLIVITSSVFAAAPATAPSTMPVVPSDTVLLFSSFRDQGEDGLHLAWSTDALKWTPVNGDVGYCKPEVGSQKLMRDPCVLPGPDGMFRMVWTTGWVGRDIGYACSKDLIHWQDQKAIPVMMHEPDAMNCWAPEVIYDSAKQQYLIFWATSIPGRFPDTDNTGTNGHNHRIYCTTTKDFQTFTSTKLFFDPGFEVIDATMLADGGRFYLTFKDETARPVAKKNIHVAVSDNIEGPFKVDPNSFSPAWVEGPTTIKLGDWYMVYFDMYRKHGYGVMRTKDWKTWEDLSDQLSLPHLTRHGTIFRVSQAIFKGLEPH